MKDIIILVKEEIENLDNLTTQLENIGAEVTNVMNVLNIISAKATNEMMVEISTLDEVENVSLDQQSRAITGGI